MYCRAKVSSAQVMGTTSIEGAYLLAIVLIEPDLDYYWHVTSRIQNGYL